ncbi:carbohydrate-binding module family 50 protein [Xylaria sp. FL0933]|nr:carbohydrate-binding module family 50 protein [Xylaria sp. FL0933]
MKPPTTSAFVLQATATIWWTISFVKGQSVQLFPFTATSTNISATCAAVLNQNVTCDASLLDLNQQFGLPHGLPALVPASQLASLCTPACAFSLAAWERRIQGACGGTRYWLDSNGDGGSFLPSAIAETFLEIYNSTCLMNSVGNICNSEIASVLSFDAMNQNFTGTPPTSVICNTCVLSAIQTQLEMPLASKPDIASYFSSLTSSCGSTTGFKPSPTPTGTTFTIAATPTAKPTCVGKTYTIGVSDTCQGISISQGISTYNLIWNNNLTSACENFPTSGTLCIPSAASCTPYTVLATDTCPSIQSKFSLLYSQLISWNPSLGVACQGLDATIGFVICVSTPGGSW